jgi:hypothetical protein
MKLKLVRFKGEIQIPSAGTTLKTTVLAKDHPDMNLRYIEGCVMGDIKGVTFAVPFENVVVLVLDSE